MTKSHSDLVSDFETGATSGKSNSMSIEEVGDGCTALVGYGHAVYAVRTPEGIIVQFDGWTFQRGRRNGGTTTTKTSHFPAMRAMADVHVAYTKPSTGAEQSAFNRADRKSDDLSKAAPKVRDAVDAANWALNSAAAVKAQAE